MIDPSVPRFPVQPDSWSEVARLCRRICLLRENDQPESAEQLRLTGLVRALAAARLEFDSDLAVEQRLEATFAIEAERVANAVVLAELLAPRLQSKFSADPRPADPVAAAADPPVAIAPPAAPAPRPHPGDIAHFIDEMIAQERAPSRRAS